MSNTHDWYWELQRKELRKIFYRISIGLEDCTDMCIASGIISQFLKSLEEQIVEEGKGYLNRFPQIKEYMS